MGDTLEVVLEFVLVNERDNLLKRYNGYKLLQCVTVNYNWLQVVTKNSIANALKVAAHL